MFGVQLQLERAPMMVEVTPGRFWSHESASRGTLVPSSFAIRFMRSSRSNVRSSRGTAGDARAPRGLVLALVRALVLAAQRAAPPRPPTA